MMELNRFVMLQCRNVRLPNIGSAKQREWLMEVQVWRGAELTEELIALRYQVLRKPLGGDPKSAHFDGDELSTTLHFAAINSPVGHPPIGVHGTAVIGCVSLMQTKTDAWSRTAFPVEEIVYQLRGMAVAMQSQGAGVGKQLLGFVHQYVDGMPEPVGLWCNARLEAISFYAKHGWETDGDEFQIPDVGPHRRMLRHQSRGRIGEMPS